MKELNITGGIDAIANKNLINADSIIKGVQRGTSLLSLNYDEITQISISSVNVEKSILLVVDTGESSGNASGSDCFFTLNSTYIEVENTNHKIFGHPTISWQVIEFY